MLLPDQAVSSEKVHAVGLLFHPDVHLVFSESLRRFRSGMVELGEIPAFGVEDVIAVELDALFFDIVIGADIDSAFVVDIESEYRRKVLGNFVLDSGPNPPVAPV